MRRLSRVVALAGLVGMLVAAGALAVGVSMFGLLSVVG